jgi:hypothetical protein
MRTSARFLSVSATLFAVTFVPTLSAHCDSLDGPVINDARTALDRGEPDVVLKWVQPRDEAAIREAFAEALAVRGLSPAARSLADRWFFETLVRIHRAGEGAPYTGLKPANAVDEAIASADRALESGEIESLLHAATHRVTQGLQTRFERVRALASHKDHSVDDGRAYVEAYVDFIHFAEAINATAPGVGTDRSEHSH